MNARPPRAGRSQALTKTPGDDDRVGPAFVRQPSSPGMTSAV